jgi:hypothetical protein
MHKIKLGTEFGSNSEKPFNNLFCLNRRDNQKGRWQQWMEVIGNPIAEWRYGESKKLPLFLFGCPFFDV